MQKTLIFLSGCAMQAFAAEPLLRFQGVSETVFADAPGPAAPTVDPATQSTFIFFKFVCFLQSIIHDFLIMMQRHSKKQYRLCALQVSLFDDMSYHLLCAAACPLFLCFFRIPWYRKNLFRP